MFTWVRTEWAVNKVGLGFLGGQILPQECVFVLLRVVCTHFAWFRLQTNLHGLWGSRETEKDLF